MVMHSSSLCFACLRARLPRQRGLVAEPTHVAGMIPEAGLFD
jgi:hypothetical protein